LFFSRTYEPCHDQGFCVAAFLCRRIITEGVDFYNVPGMKKRMGACRIYTPGRNLKVKNTNKQEINTEKKKLKEGA